MCNCNQTIGMTTEQILAARIPEELHQDVILLANRTYNVLIIDALTMQSIFQIWNQYVDSEDKDMNCYACRMRVIGRFRQIAQVYAE